MSLIQELKVKDKQLFEQYMNEFIEKIKNVLKTNDLSTKEIIVKYNYFIAMGRVVK